MADKEGNSRNLWKVGVGIGLLGGAALAVRYAMSPATREPLPEFLSPDAFATRLYPSSYGDIVFHEGGSGSPVVFLHAPAVGGSSYEWSLVYPALADRGHIFALDLLGFGESQKLSQAVDADQHVDSIAQFLQGVCDSRPVALVASGLAGGFATLLASRHPDLVAQLCLVMPTGLSEFGRRRLTRRASIAAHLPAINRFIYKNYLARRAAIQRWLTNFAFGNSDKVTSEMVDAYTACAQQNNAEHAIYALMGGKLSLPIEARLRLLQQRVLLIWGGLSAFPPLEWANQYKLLVPDCSLSVIENAGFLAALEAPHEMISILEEHLFGSIRAI